MGHIASTENTFFLVNNVKPTPTKFLLNMVSVSVGPYLELIRFEKVLRFICLSGFSHSDPGSY